MRRLFLLVMLLSVIVSASCSSVESTGTSSEAINGACGGFSLSAPEGSDQSTTVGAVNLIVPATLGVSFIGGGPPASETISGTLQFDSVTTCTYSRGTTGTPSDGDPLPLMTCTNGEQSGATVALTGSATLTLTVPGTNPADVVLAADVSQNIDDGNPCTIDRCVSGSPDHSETLHDNTPVAGGGACNTTSYCSGGSPVTGSALPATVYSGCNVLKCDSTEGYYIYSSTCTSPSGVSSYNSGDNTVASDISEGMQFLFSGQGVSLLPSGSMDPKRLSIVRGRVIDRAGSAIASATVTVLGHSEFGSATTRSGDGGFDIVVNGGGTLTVQVAASGHLTIQRQAKTRWLDWTTLPDIVLTAPETPTSVALNAGSWAFLQGATHGGGGDDPDPVRTATILIPPSTTISSCSGSTDCSGGCWTGGSPVNIHATEYTVGSAGRNALPGDLPPQSGYTYAVEAGLTDAPDTSVTFNHPVFFYLDNFTGSPLDTSNTTNAIPTGSYDRTRGVWTPEASGKTYCIISISGEQAEIGLDCGTPLTPDGSGDYTTESPVITSGERTELAMVYPSAWHMPVWRVPMPHFSGWDMNWGAGPPSGAMQPPNARPEPNDPTNHSPCAPGSIIECENQVLRESIPIVGTPYSLNYRSETQNGFHPTLTIPVADGSTLPGSLLRIEAEIQVAGQDAVLQGDPTSTHPQTLTWSWDRTDAYGRLVQGAMQAHVEVRYVYDSVPFTNTGGANGGFGDLPVVTDAGSTVGGNRITREVWFARDYDFEIGAFDDEPLGLGGWTLSAHHVYQPSTATLFMGTGVKREPSQMPDVLSSYYTSTDSTETQFDIAATADGYIWAAHKGSDGLYLGRLDTCTPSSCSFSAKTRTSGSESTWTDGSALSNIKMNWGSNGYIFAEPSGDLLISDRCRILRATPSMTVSLVAGVRDGSTCASGFAADGATASGTAVGATFGAADMPDGSVVFLEYPSSSGTRIRHIKPDGTLETLVGDGGGGSYDISAVGSPCLSGACDPHGVRLSNDGQDYSVAVAPDATVYFGDSYGNRVWQLHAADGRVYLLVGTGTGGNDGDGTTSTSSTPPLMNTSATIWTDEGTSIAMAGADVLIPSPYSFDGLVRKVDPAGTITTLAGLRTSGLPVFGVFATQSAIAPVRTVLGPDDYYYTTAESSATTSPSSIVRFRRADDILTSGGDTLVASPDGSEVYEFDSTGRHLYTKSRYSGATLVTHTYTSDKLTSIAGLEGTTTIDYSGPVTITAPTGQVTTLTLTSNYLTSVAAPIGTYTMTYSGSGLLSTFVEPVGNTHTLEFSDTGQLVTDAPPNSSGTKLARSDLYSSFSVDVSSPADRTTTHQVDDSPSSTDTFTGSSGVYTRDELHTHTAPSTYPSSTSTDAWYSDMSHVETLADGTTTSMSYSPDPRFGMAAAYASTTKIATASNHTTRYASRSASSCTDPFSCATVTDETWTGTDSHHTRVWTSSTNTLMDTTPESRATKYTLDSYGRITKIAPQGTTPSCVYPISITYGGSGYDNNQVTEIDQESDATSCTGSDSTRTTTIGHATSGATKGFINQVVTPTMTTTYTPDDDGRMTGIGLPGSRSITLGYDDDGALTAVTPPLGSSYKHQFVENSLDLLGTYEPPALSGYVNTTYTYDLDGLLIGTHPPTANVVTYTRDSAGRVSGVSYNDPVSGTITVTMSYDATTGHACTSGCTASNGSSTGLDPGTTTTDAYDGDLMTSETTAFTSPTASHTVDWGYDDHLRLQTRDIDAESFTSTTLGYDQDDNIASATVDGPSTMYVYRGSTGLISCTNLTNICEVYTYNAFGELKEQKAVNGSCTSSCSPSGTTLLDIQYGRNSDGRIHTKNEVIGLSSCDWTYAYDAEDYTTNTNLYPEYLYTAARSGGTNCGALSYTSKYDADGNIKGTADFYGSFASTFNAQDQLTYDGYWSYAYDAQGNVRSQSAYGEYSYMYYDPLGNLREGVNYPSSTYGFDIDVKNRRVGRVAGGSFIGGYVYDGDRVIAELDSSGALKSYFVYVTKANVPDIMVASDGTVYRMLSDQIGSVRRVINVSTGASIENLSFDPYGLTVSWPNATAIWPTVQPFGFAGGIWDSTTALYRFGARDYSPFKGSWWSKDPILVGGGLNLYQYCGGDPVNCVDPNGTTGDLLTCMQLVKPFDFAKLIACLLAPSGGPNASGGGPFRTSPERECDQAWNDAYDAEFAKSKDPIKAAKAAAAAEDECRRKNNLEPRSNECTVPVVPLEPVPVVP